MTKIVKIGKSKAQAKKKEELAKKEYKKRMEKKENEENERNNTLFEKWRYIKCFGCETTFKIENRKDIISSSYGYPRKYFYNVKCPNCGRLQSVDNIPWDGLPSGDRSFFENALIALIILFIFVILISWL